MSVLSVFQWTEATPIGEFIRSSLWLFPVIEALHLLGFAALGGTVLLVDLHLIGIILTDRPSGEIAREAQPWLLSSLLVMFGSGGLLFVSEAVKCYYSTPFWIKMSSLMAAVAFTFTIVRRVAAADHAMGAWQRTLAGIVSITLWAGVAWGGRWIGFSG